MKPEEIAKRYVTVASEWPVGAMVWHRGSGDRGVIVEHCIQAGGDVLIGVAFDVATWSKCLSIELSARPVPGDDEGEGWKREKA